MEELPGADRFYDQLKAKLSADGISSMLYTNDKTSYPLAFRQYKSTDDDETKYDLAREIITKSKGR